MVSWNRVRVDQMVLEVERALEFLEGKSQIKIRGVGDWGIYRKMEWPT